MNKKIILIIVLIILLVLIIFLSNKYVFSMLKQKNFIEKYDVKLADELNNSDFKIEKMMIYSSASGINKNENFQNTDWVLDIFQYADIALYFSKPKELSTKNTVKTLNISNVKFNIASEKFKPALYYLDANTFGTDNILLDYKIEDNLDFTVLNFDNKDNSIKYNTPVFFSDLSNPVTLKFTNILLENHTIENKEKLIFDGNILSKVPLKKEDLKASISFDILITNFENEAFSTNFSIQIPLENEKHDIFDGSVLIEKKVNMPLLKNDNK